MKASIFPLSLLALSIAAPAFASERVDRLAQAHQMAPHEGGGKQPMTAQMPGHDMSQMQMDMKGMFGSYAMTREASGTSWQPDSTKMEGIHGMYGGWSTMIHGFATAIYDDQGGPRGNTKSFVSSMFMAMAQRDVGPGTLGLRGMFSLDPLTMGKSGYPQLLQTGETADGRTPLVDRQHPHDLFMELAASYSYRLAADRALFGYVGLPGEPALGPPTFMHRFSGADNPESPLGHHWLDSTHISFGVVTLGYVSGGLKLETSLFNGREPDEDRYNIELRRLRSSSVRLSYNPTPDWAMQVSYGRLKSPEQLEPDVDINRTTASLIYNKAFGANNWQTTLAWGRNAKTPGATTNAYLLESALTLGAAHTIFGRLERVGKDELFREDEPLAGQTFTVKKASVGYIHDITSRYHARFGVGALVAKHFIPSALTPAYGNDPTSYMLFVRVKLQ